MPFRNLPGVSRCRFQKGECLIRTGEEISYVYYMIKGEVFRNRLTEDGQESVVGTKSGGGVVQSIVGILPLYRGVDRNISYDDFVAAVDCECYRIPREVCREYMRAHPEYLEDAVTFALENLDRREQLNRAKACKHTASYLCHFLLEKSVQTASGRVVPKSITNEQIAKFLAVHYTTVARILRTLKEEGVVARCKDGLKILDEALLEDYASGAVMLKYKS